MRLFNPDTPQKSDRHIQLYAMYEFAFTVVDFAASILFVVGSVLFFYTSTTILGTWMFLVGSICFGVKPSIRVIREFHLLRLGDAEVLAEREAE